jgi:hypothetical protein
MAPVGSSSGPTRPALADHRGAIAATLNRILRGGERLGRSFRLGRRHGNTRSVAIGHHHPGTMIYLTVDDRG